MSRRHQSRARLNYLLRCARAKRIERTLIGDGFEPRKSRCFDRRGEPISMARWTALVQCFPNEHTRIRSTRIRGTPLWVSTVWLGLDHSFGFGGRKTIFETMVFGVLRGVDRDCERYETEEEAIAGHARMVERWSQPLPTQPEATA